MVRDARRTGARGRTYIEKVRKQREEMIDWLELKAWLAVRDWLSLDFDFRTLRHLEA